jgi:putative ABC transport system permease protein
MNFTQSIRIAFEMLMQHKLRAFLTMLGVIIGVMSVTLIVMISNGFKSYLTGQFERAGADTMFMFFDPSRRFKGESTGGVDRMTLRDIDYVKGHVSSIEMVSACVVVQNQQVKFGAETFDNPVVYGIDQNFQKLNRYDLVEGRAISDHDVAQMANVCVIGEDVRDRLFPDKKSIGKLVLLNGIALEVVGVIEKQTFLGQSTGRQVYAPLTTVQKKWQGGDRVDFLMLRAYKGISVDTAMQSVWEAMMAKSNNRAIYRLDSNESIMNIFGGVVGAAGLILAGVAALALLVGGIGIMNIMLVSVTERTREIGLRKAVGARRVAILIQFLIEAGTLSLVGGLIGMALAWLLGQGITAMTVKAVWPNKDGLVLPFPIGAAIMAAAFSAGIGMLFGFYPAMTASKLDPIVALRTE